MKQRLSIVIPCLNEAKTIGPLLDSLQPLLALGHELVVVDGGSRDGTFDVAAQRLLPPPSWWEGEAEPVAWVPGIGVRASVILIRSDPGRARQMNAGARAASGDTLWFLHADTHLPPEAPEALLAALADGCAWGRFHVRLSGRSRPLLRLVEATMNLRSRLTGIATGDQGIFVRRELFEAVGGFPEIPLMEEIALCRLLKRRARPCCLKNWIGTSSRRWERNGIPRTILLMWGLRLAYFLGVSPERLARLYYPCPSDSPTRES